MLGSTKIYGCLADPIDHVKAPTIFTAIFKEKNIDAVMVPIHCLLYTSPSPRD